MYVPSAVGKSGSGAQTKDDMHGNLTQTMYLFIYFLKCFWLAWAPLVLNAWGLPTLTSYISVCTPVWVYYGEVVNKNKMIWGKSLLSQVPHHVHIYKIIHRGTEIKIKDTFFLEILKTGEKKK